jgi:hypothetical protein
MVEAKDRAGRPILDAEGNPTFNTVPVGDVDRFMKVAEALSLASFRLARFQSPTLQAIAVPQQQAQSSQPIHFKVHIRNAEGEHVMTTIDREVVDGGEPDMKLIESDRSDGPNDRTDGPDGSDDGA